MTDIIVAYASADPIGADYWGHFMAAFDDPARERFTVRTPVAVWRAMGRGNGLPQIAVHERVYLVLDGVTFGYAPLIALPKLSAEGKGRVIKLRVDLRRFVPCQLEWTWGQFRRSWRYVRFSEACLSPFPDWRTVAAAAVARREPWVPDAWQQLAAAESAEAEAVAR